ncbi:SusC/RagA family TonB-linked outer membrane protein [Flammeovirga kamogawensis]|uniref:TonB-dependent receptor n=1 Tax=Flammeovirga kamogawensis TaxID=373891 RepID=A0ABX8H1I1_9BACT|nr:TonB-dependent receptor [Flammeovirga kamogawensis]MBB6463292.1 iron complex outermembrane receptor protein [Flammeovirga kamogawensis]QWG09558.1 TonB-dependent receptor [Flammeovirga kamogawensis]TRX65072.1 TonB-dependent receptor [Flammeovirga kamogawensis]
MKIYIKSLSVFCFIIAMLLNTTNVFAQEDFTLTGLVVDENNEPLIGVTVALIGDFETPIGTTTDFDGNYKILVPEGVTGVSFRYMGYETQTFDLTNQTNISVTLKEDIDVLNEVVVVGYGTQEKKDVTGAMSSVDREDFNSGVMSNPTELIQGRATGVQITPSSGEPGAAVSVNIRGTSSVRGNNGPLYVIDGVPLGGGAAASGSVGGGNQAPKDPLNFLNPDDIESIDILKDASATAIYGSRGSNGVVMITTKKAKNQEGKVSYSAYGGMAWVRKKIDLLSSDDWRLSRALIAQSTGDLSFLDWDYGGNTNWQDEIFRTAYSQNHNLSVSGGSETGNYLASLGYMDQEGVIESSGMKRLTGRLNIEQRLLDDRWKVGFNLSASTINDTYAPLGTGSGTGDTGANNLIGSALRGNPTMPIYNEDGSYFQTPTDVNPVALINLINDESVTDRYLANVTSDFKIIEGLHYNLSIAYDRSNAQRKGSRSKDLQSETNGTGTISNNQNTNFSIENFVTYSKTINKHDFSVMGGFSYQKFDYEFNGMYVDNFFSSAVDYADNLNQAANKQASSVWSGGGSSELQSYFGRFNYSFNDKYLITASMRADGSTKFGDNNKYGYFPSAALGWRISEEAFLYNSDVVSNLKLRGGWGQTGNQEIPDHIPLMIYNPVTVNDEKTYEPDHQPNEDIKWETTTQANIGVDFGFFNDKISGTLDYFHKSTTDLLFKVDLTPPALATVGYVNLPAQLINKGFEASLKVYWITDGDWEFSSNVNFTMIENNIQGLDNDAVRTGRLNGPGISSTQVQVIQDNYPLQTFYTREFRGFDQEGYSKYTNAEGGTTGSADAAVERHLGSPHPDYMWSLNNTLKYKSIDFSVFIDAKHGQNIYNNTAHAFYNKRMLSQAGNTTYANLMSEKNLDQEAITSSEFIEDATFLRLSNITLGYNFNTSNISWMSGARIYATGQNLFVWTNYTGYDPEVNASMDVNGYPSFGIDYTSYPRPSTVIIGINVNL